MPETRFSDYVSFLQDLEASGVDHFLEGGQAVNFWAEYFSAKGTGEDLVSFLPFTSKDCDIWVSYAALQDLRAKKSGGRLRTGSSPADGQVGIFTMDGSPPMTIDLLSNVYGIPQSKSKQLKERSLVIQGIRVIDPIFLFQSKCHCLLGLDQVGRQDEKHLRMLCFIVREHLEGLLSEAIADRLSQRALINEIKLLQKLLKTSSVRRALEDIGEDARNLIPIDQLHRSGLTKAVRFAELMDSRSN
ncbi:MAG: hypothetical protein ACJAXZ_003444 [Akkermansiaceae bacterium]|jgi:hypothetical protein